MWECDFAREPMDFKLFWLLFFKKIWLFLTGILIGILLIGGSYFIKNIVFAPEKEYRVVGEIYLDYVLGEGQIAESVCFNQVTWASLVKTDEFLEDVGGQLMRDGIEISAESLAESMEATLLSDVRIVTTTVTTNNPALSVAISHALQSAILHFGEKQAEIAGMRILTSPKEAEPVKLDIRLLRAVILGAVLGGFLALLGMFLYFTLDDSIHIPDTVQVRYKIPMLGMLSSKELTQNFKALCKDKKKLALTASEGSIPIEKIAKSLEEKLKAEKSAMEGRLFMPVCCVGDKPEAVEELLKAESIILVIGAGRRDGKRIEKTLRFLDRQGCKPDCALLWGEDEKLVTRYYGAGIFGGKG